MPQVVITTGVFWVLVTLLNLMSPSFLRQCKAIIKNKGKERKPKRAKKDFHYEVN